MRTVLLPLALLSAAAVVAAGAAPARAQDEAQAARAFAIPAGALAEALNRFADESGLQLVYDAAVTQGLTTSGVAGSFTPEQALARLLEGTGLGYRFTAPDVVTLQAGGDGALATAPLQVEAAVPAGAVGLTEGTHSYVSETASVGTKVPTDIRHTPQTVSVATRREIEDRGSTLAQDVFRRRANITVQDNFVAGGGNVVARGFRMGGQFDGAPARNWTDLQEMAIFDHVEILLGPAGLAQAQGEPSGVVNYVRKRPRADFGASGLVSYGSWDNWHGEADVTGGVGEEAKLRYRFVGTMTDREFHYDVAKQQRELGYGIVEVDLAETTMLTLSGVAGSHDTTPFLGLPRDETGAVFGSPSTYVGSNWAIMKTDTYEGYVDLTHGFDNGWEVKATGRYNWFDLAQRYAFAGSPVDSATGTLNMLASRFDAAFHDAYADLHVAGPFQAFGRTHQVAAGIDTQYGYTEDSNFGITFLGPQSVFDHDLPNVDAGSFGTSDLRTIEYGGYANATFQVADPLQLMVGSRLAFYRDETRALTPVPDNWLTGSSIDAQVVPFAGLVYDLSDQVSAYGSYAEIFRPQADLGVDGKPLPPITGTQYEVGLKGDFMDDALTARGSLFLILDENRAVAIPNCVGFLCSEAAGEAQSQGFDGEVVGTILPGWDVIAGYAYTDTTFKKAEPGVQGTPFAPFVPRHSGQLWSTYTWQQGSLAGLMVGGGLKAVSSFREDVFKAQGYVVASAAVGYTLGDHVSASLLVDNLFDDQYLVRVGGTNTNNFFGEPRSVLFQLRAEW